MRPGGGEPSLALLPEIKARLTCVFGTADPLIPAEDREAIQVALRQVDPAGQRLRVVEMCRCRPRLHVRSPQQLQSPGLSPGMAPAAG